MHCVKIYNFFSCHCTKLFIIFQVDKHIGVAIGDLILDLNVISHLFTGPLLADKQQVFKVTLCVKYELIYVYLNQPVLA